MKLLRSLSKPASNYYILSMLLHEIVVRFGNSGIDKRRDEISHNEAVVNHTREELVSCSVQLIDGNDDFQLSDERLMFMRCTVYKCRCVDRR